MAGLMRAWTAGFSAAHPENPARIILESRYPGELVEALAWGRVEVVPFAREAFAAEHAQFAAVAGGGPRLVPVARGSRATQGGTHAIVFFVHERNPLTRLTIGHLREILAADGRIRTWGDLGLTGERAGQPIKLHGMLRRRESGNPPGIVNYLEQRLLQGRPWRNGIGQYADAPGEPQALEQITRAVAADENGLGYSGFAYAVPGVRPLALAETDAGPYYAGSAEDIAAGRYPLSRKVYFAVGPHPSEAAREFIAYVLSPAGQGIIAQDHIGFFPLTGPEIQSALAQLDAPTPAELPQYVPHPVTVPAGAGYVRPDGAISVVGYNDMKEMLGALGDRFAVLYPGIRFSLTLDGTRTAPPALARGTSAFAPMGAEFSPEQLADYRANVGGEPQAFRVAHCSLNPAALSGPLAIIVHQANPLDALALEEVAAVFSGRMSRGLRPYGLAAGTALGQFMSERVMGGSRFAPDFKGFPQSRNVVAAVASDPQGIGFTAAMRAGPGVKVLSLARRRGEEPVALTLESLTAGAYPLDRCLLIYVKQPLEPWVREFLRFVLSTEGQDIIGRGTLGYLPLNAVEVAVERAKLDALASRDGVPETKLR